MQDIRQGILSRKTRDENGKNRESVEGQYARDIHALDLRRKKQEDINEHRFKVYLGSKEDKYDIS